MDLKKFLIQLIVFFALTQPVVATCSDEYALLIFDPNTHQILEQKRAYDLKYPASLVKLMTLYLTFEALEFKKLSLDTKLIASERVAEQWKFNADLVAGDMVTVEEAILGIVVKSFNDFAVLLAEAVGDNEWNFVKMMNAKAKELGLEYTSFRNSAGFTDIQQETTAYDMMKLVQKIREDFPQYYSLFATKKFKFRGVTHQTHNHVLADYPWAEGMKTGFTNASGYNLATTAHKNGKDLIAIIISCSSKEDRDDFIMTTLDQYFETLEKAEKKQTVKFASKNIKK